MDDTASSGGQAAAQGTPFRTRMQAVFSADGRTAVLLRRGPKTHFNLIVWHLAEDRFEAGQWMKGSVGLWDLSPSGRKVIYYAEQPHPSAVLRRQAEDESEGFDPVADQVPRLRPGRKLPRYMQPDARRASRKLPRRNTGCWTAISTPPYFTALALWPAVHGWTGGGGFLSERAVFLHENDEGMVPVAKVPLPHDLRVLSSRLPNAGVTLRPSGTWPLYSSDKTHPLVWSALVEGGLALLDWFYPGGEDLLFAAGGQIYRLRKWQEIAPEDYVSRARLLVDVSQERFRLVAPPPSAMRW